jgi:hypothetical protein
MQYTYNYITSSTGDGVQVQPLDRNYESTSTVEPTDRLEEIGLEKQLLEVEKNMLLEKALSSNDPKTLIKAQSFLEEILDEDARNKEGGVTIMSDPYLNQYSQHGFKTKRAQLSPGFLRKMGSTTVVRAIITTRQSQIENFSSPRKGKYDMGFVIEKKPTDFYTDEEPKMSLKDKKQVKYLTNFLLNGGDKKEGETLWGSDTFTVFLRKIVEDSLTLDAATAEIVPNRGGDPSRYFAVDAGTIYQAHIDKSGNYEARTGAKPKEIKGYYPSHVQVVDGKIVSDYYPWEIMYGVRNARTDIYQNGYGKSELEDLINIITWQLNTDQYNGKFFTQGSNPKGILKVSKGLNRNRIAELRQEWRSMVVGTKNAHKIPVLEGEGVEWIDLHKNNADMQFNEWQEYLIKIICALYKIAPEEIGIEFNKGGGINSSSGQETEAKMKFSRDKGLYPLLKAIESWINKWIIWQIDSTFRFRFVGLDIESEDKELDKDIKAAGSFMGLKEVRRKRGLADKIDDDDMIMNQIWLSKNQGDAMAGQQEESTDAAAEWDDIGVDDGGDGDEGAPDEEGFQKALETTLQKYQGNPMMKDAMQLFNKLALDDE